MTIRKVKIEMTMSDETARNLETALEAASERLKKEYRKLSDDDMQTKVRITNVRLAMEDIINAVQMYFE